MDDKAKEAIVTQFIEKVYNSGQLNYIGKLVHPEFQFHGLQGVENIEDLKLSFAYLHINWNSVFEDLYFSIESIQTNNEYIEVTLRKLGKTKNVLSDESSESYDSMVTIKEKFLIEEGQIKERWSTSPSPMEQQPNRSNLTDPDSEFRKI